MKLNCLINQPAGLGDIIVCLKIAKIYSERGYNVIWPIKDFYLDVVKKHIDVDFVEWHCDSNYSKLANSADLILNLDGATSIHPNLGIVDAKYAEAKIYDFEDWVDYFNLVRDIDRESELTNLVKERIKTKKYTLVNNNYGTPPNTFRKKIIADTDNDIVEMSLSPKYNIFDWIGVIENAAEIWTVDTCIHYIMDHPSIRLKAERLEMFSRYEPANFENVVKKVVKNKNWSYNE